MKQWAWVGILALAVVWSATPTGAASPTGDALLQAGSVPTGETALGTVRIPRAVMADGKPLAAGTYRVRLTPQAARPDVPGQLPQLNRWVEFVQGGTVKGREVVSIVPQGEIGQVAEDAPPPSGSAKVQMLRGNDYLRVWINRGGTHYLIHLPPA